MNRARLLRLLTLALFLPVGSAAAQSSASRWAAWLGCWEPASEAGISRSATCVLPGTSAEAVELVMLSGDSVAQRSTIVADGALRTIDADGCTGTESARFSTDGARVLLTGEVRCNDGPVQRTSGVIAISESGQWLDVHGIRVGEQRSLRVRRSRAMTDLGGVPADVRATLAARARGDVAARVGAAVPLSLATVTETSAAVDERVVEAWLLESARDGAGMKPVDANGLAKLAAAGVPGRVIDVVVALGYPKKFQVALTADGAGQVSAVEGAAGGSTIANGRMMHPDVFAYSYYDMQRCRSYACYLYYSDSPYFYGYGLAGWNNYNGWGMYPGWGYGGPITVIVRPTPNPGGGGGGSPSGGGRVVKGRGYTPSGSGGTTAGEPVRPRTEPAASSGSAATSSGSSSGGAAKSSGTTEKSEPRTAKPRKP